LAGCPFGEDSGSSGVSRSMGRCEDGIGILVAESGEQEGASEEIAPLGECGSDQICPQSAENRAAGLFRYGRPFGHEAQPLLIETWCRRLSDSVFSSFWKVLIGFGVFRRQRTRAQREPA
jgi:hypothetical protein